MANLTPSPGFSDVVQLETTTPALAGPGGPMNQQAQALLNRTEALRHPVEAVAATSRAVVPADQQRYLRFTAAGAKTASFTFASGFAIGQEFHLANRAASGDLTLSGSGVTLSPPKGGALVLEPGDTVTVKFITPDTADVFGSTAAA